MEVLAPAGGREQLIAAVYSGADAVYLGTKGFNARRKADNFGEDELKQAVAWCHGRGVRVHVTVNTLVTDSELPALFDTVREVAESGADAVILQDLAAGAPRPGPPLRPLLPRHLEPGAGGRRSGPDHERGHQLLRPGLRGGPQAPDRPGQGALTAARKA